MAISTKAVNKEIAKLGGSEILVKGVGYWYFTEGRAHEWPATMVYVMRLSDLTLDQWVGEYKALKADFERYLAS